MCSERERGRVLAGAGIKGRGAERNKNKNKSHSSFDGFSVGHSGSIPLRASSSVCSSDRQVQDHHLPRCPALPRTPPVLGNFVWVRRLFLASSSSLRPRGERVENPFCMRSSPPTTLIHFRTLIFFVLFEFSQRDRKNLKKRERASYHRAQGEETRNREGNSPGAKVWGQSVGPIRSLGRSTVDAH